jgi:hypothetical protein
VVALVIVLVLDLGIIVGQRIAGTTVLNATFYALTIGTIALLVAYLLATLGAVKFLFLGTTPKAPRWQIILPLAGIAFVGYTIYKNVVGLSPPYSYFPYIIGIWLLVGLAVVLLSPGQAERVRRNLAGSTSSDTTEPEVRA